MVGGLCLRMAILELHRCTYSDRAIVGLDTTQIGGGGAGGVGHLHIGTVGLAETHIRELLEGELLLLAAQVNATRRDCRYGHAVANEEHHIPGQLGVQSQLTLQLLIQCLGRQTLPVLGVPLL